MVLRRTLLLLLIVVLHVPCVQAQDGALWMCWLGERDDYGIHCLRDSDPVLDGADEMLLAKQVASQGRVVNGPRRDAQIWTIALYAPPFDLNEVKLLTQSVMCGNEAGCEVVFTRREAQVAGN